MDTLTTEQPKASARQNCALAVESVRIRWEVDVSADLSHIGEYTDDYDPCNVVAIGEHEGELAGNVPDDELPDRGREYRYFKPYAGGETPSTDKRKRYHKYAIQDYNRASAQMRGDWQPMGCFIEAEISRPIGQGCKRLETLRSGGLWSIESDCGEDYRKEVEDEQFADLVEHLDAFGIETTTETLRAIADERE